MITLKLKNSNYFLCIVLKNGFLKVWNLLLFIKCEKLKNILKLIFIPIILYYWYSFCNTLQFILWFILIIIKSNKKDITVI